MLDTFSRGASVARSEIRNFENGNEKGEHAARAGVHTHS